MSKHSIGSTLAVANGDVVKIIKCLTPNATGTDADINLYEVENADGHHDVMASDNGSVWLVGYENDADVNRAQFQSIDDVNGESVLWDEIEDCDLREWITDRRNESKLIAIKIITVAFTSGPKAGDEFQAKSVEEAKEIVRDGVPTPDSIFFDEDITKNGDYEIIAYSCYNSPSLKNLERDVAVITVAED